MKDEWQKEFIWTLSLPFRLRNSPAEGHITRCVAMHANTYSALGSCGARNSIDRKSFVLSLNRVI